MCLSVYLAKKEKRKKKPSRFLDWKNSSGGGLDFFFKKKTLFPSTVVPVEIKLFCTCFRCFQKSTINLVSRITSVLARLVFLVRNEDVQSSIRAPDTLMMDSIKIHELLKTLLCESWGEKNTENSSQGILPRWDSNQNLKRKPLPGIQSEMLRFCSTKQVATPLFYSPGGPYILKTIDRHHWVILAVFPCSNLYF